MLIINPRLVLQRHDTFTTGVVYMPFLLAYLAGNLIPAIGSGNLSKVSIIIVKSLLVFLIQKTAQFG